MTLDTLNQAISNVEVAFGTFFPQKTNIAKRYSPCIGKCSTIQGDTICTGCFRYGYEVLGWQHYSTSKQAKIWQRLDSQLELLLGQLLSCVYLQQIKTFVAQQGRHLPPVVSDARYVYEALRLCERTPELLKNSGLGLSEGQLVTFWFSLQDKLLQLAQVQYATIKQQHQQLTKLVMDINS